MDIVEGEEKTNRYSDDDDNGNDGDCNGGDNEANKLASSKLR